MNNRETKNLLVELKKVNNLTGFSLTMGVADAVERIEKEQDVLEKIRVPSKKYEKYQEEAVAVNKKFSFIDENGDPKTTVKNFPNGQSMSFLDLDPSKNEDRLKELKIVETKYAKEIEDQASKEEKYSDAMNEKSTLKLTTVSITEKVADTISVEQMMLLRKILKITIPK